MTDLAFPSFKELGKFAKKARGCMKSQSDVAKQAGWGQRLVSELERGTGIVSLICTEEIFQSYGYKLTYTLEKNDK